MAKMSDEERRKYLLQKYVSEIATEEELKALEDPARKEQVLKELLDRAENFRKITVEGAGYDVEGNVYPLKEILKEYGAKWDSYERNWYGEITGTKMFWKMAYELDAVVSVKVIPPEMEKYIPPAKQKIYREIINTAEKHGTLDMVAGKIILDAGATREVWESLKGREMKVE